MNTQLTLDGQRATVPYADEATLRELYHERGLSLRQVADELDCHYTTVHQYMNEYGIDRRDANYRPEKEGHASLTIHPEGYELCADASKTVLVHRLVAVAMAGFDAVRDGVVHHENGVQWDNRPSNLTVVDSRRAHARIHNRPELSDDQVRLSEVSRSR